MIYRNHLPSEYEEELTTRREQYLKHYKGKDALKEMAVIANKEAKKDYLRFGMYWWALKDVLVRQNLMTADEEDRLVASEYKGETDIDTLILAFIFRDFYDANMFQGTNDFTLNDDSALVYHLFDPDMQ